MTTPNLQEERKRFEEKIKRMKDKMIRLVEQGRLYGLHRQVRQVQKSYQVTGRV